MSKITVNYVIQSDPWDIITEPNVYFLPENYTDPNKITARLIKDTFPIKSQRFFFRFYLLDKIENLRLWMDLPPNATIPVYTDKVFVKVLRIPLNADEDNHTSDYLFEKTERIEKVEKRMKDDNKTMVSSSNFDGFDFGSISQQKPQQTQGEQVLQPQVPQQIQQNTLQDQSKFINKPQNTLFNVFDDIKPSDSSKINNKIKENKENTYEFEFLGNESYFKDNIKQENTFKSK
jgi:hypothetical protein